MFRDQPVSRWMSSDVATVGLDTPVSTVRHLLDRHPYHHLPVLQDGVLVGIISVTDVSPLCLTAYVDDASTVDAYLDARFTVGQVMTTELVTIQPTDTLGHAASLLAEGSFHALPVVEHGGRLVGILTSTDIIRAFVAP